MLFCSVLNLMFWLLVYEEILRVDCTNGNWRTQLTVRPRLDRLIPPQFYQKISASSFFSSNFISYSSFRYSKKLLYIGAICIILLQQVTKPCLSRRKMKANKNKLDTLGTYKDPDKNRYLTNVCCDPTA